jgi:pimeloyl-ACP methyl ester carboxylesterase
MKKITGAYTQGWELIVKPRKYEYWETDLGLAYQVINQTPIERIDFHVLNQRNQKLAVSLFGPASRINCEGMPCIIYLHTHSGNRLESLHLLKYFLPDYQFCTFDFSGCGLSEGDFVTLGLKEAEDLFCVIKYLETKFKILDFALWGRSMGAVTSIVFASSHKYARIRAMVLDAPFSKAKSSI